MDSSRLILLAHQTVHLDSNLPHPMCLRSMFPLDRRYCGIAWQRRHCSHNLSLLHIRLPSSVGRLPAVRRTNMFCQSPFCGHTTLSLHENCAIGERGRMQDGGIRTLRRTDQPSMLCANAVLPRTNSALRSLHLDSLVQLLSSLTSSSYQNTWMNLSIHA